MAASLGSGSFFGELLASCPIHREDLHPHRGPRALRQRIFE